MKESTLLSLMQLGHVLIASTMGNQLILTLVDKDGKFVDSALPLSDHLHKVDECLLFMSEKLLLGECYDTGESMGEQTITDRRHACTVARASNLSTVRRNLLTVKGYTPYCGSDKCTHRNPRTKWVSHARQFGCSCGWLSQFEEEFISKVMLVQGLK